MADQKKKEKKQKQPKTTEQQDRRSVLIRMRPGMTVRVHQKIVEGEKTRIQIFEGMVIGRHRNLEPNATFRVRKISEGVGVERIFPAWSPLIERIDLVSEAQVRQAKLGYLRNSTRKLKETPIKA